MEIDLGKPADNAVQFLLLRAQAINSYAGLESSLCRLLSTLLGTDLESTSIIFYQLVNTRSRSRILEQLIKKRFKDEHTAYFHGVPYTPHKRGLMTLVSELDTTRNEIIHWHTVNQISGDDASHASTLVLKPPAFFFSRQESVRTTADLVDFIGKSDFVQRSINMFCMWHDGPLDGINDDWRKPWHDIFQQPCVYPPPDNHPLVGKP